MDLRENNELNSDIDCWIVLCHTTSGNMEKADLYYQEVLEAGNITTKFCNYIGNEFFYYGYYMESIEYFDEALRINQEDREAYINKLYSLYYGKRYSRCIEFGKYALEVFIDDFDIISYIAECYYNLTDYEETLVWYKRYNRNI